MMTLREYLKENAVPYDLFSDLTEEDMAKNIIDIAIELRQMHYKPVVRCEECEHWNTEKKSFYGTKCRCERFSLGSSEIYTLPNAFCSYGERRNDDATD